MSGRLTVIGLGPGDERWLTPQAEAAEKYAAGCGVGAQADF